MILKHIMRGMKKYSKANKVVAKNRVTKRGQDYFFCIIGSKSRDFAF